MTTTDYPSNGDAMAEAERSTDRPNGSGAVLLTAAGLAAAFGVASCCALPVLLSGMGVGVAWLAGVAAVAEPLRSILIVAAAACLVGGGVLLWRQRSTICAPGSICARPAVRGLTVIGLTTGAILLYLGYVYV